MKKNKILISLFLLLLSLSAIAQLVVFESNNPVKAQEMNQNFNYLKLIFQNKNVTIPFSTYYSGEVIENQKIETDFDLVRNLGITVPPLSSQIILAHELNASFSAIEFEALIYNDTPVASSGAATILEDESLVGILNFVNVVGPTNVQIVNNVSNGSLILNSVTGQFTYFPNVNYNGSDSFSYKVSDGTLESPVRTFNITIDPVNDSPTISSITNQTVNEDTASSSINFTISDVESSLNCSTSVSGTSSNTALISGVTISGTAPNCIVQFSPLANKFGTSSITLSVTDGILISSTSFSANVTAVDDVPVVVANSANLNEDVESILNINYTDIENDLATACTISSLTNVSVTTACACVSGVCSVGIKGNSNFNGAASFSYTVTANGKTSNSATYSLSIAAINDAPIITAGSLTTRRGVTGSSSMTATDVEGNSITYSTQSLPTKGVLTFNSNGSFSFVPTLGVFGTDSFTVVASDGVNSSTPFVVNITINNIGIDGDLTITSGQTVTLAAGSQRQYTNLTIASGGTLQITGTSATTTKIEVFGTMSVNGTIRAITNSNTATNSTLTFNGETFAHSRAQQAAGSGAGSPTANGSHGNPLVIFANTLNGTGSINSSGISSADGAAGAYSRTCGSGYYLHQLTISGCNGKYTCLQNGYGPNISCGSSGSCTTACSNFISKIEQIKELLQNLNPINSAYAGGGGFCIPPSCVQTTPTGTYGTRQGTGAGGNGGNIWIRTVNAYGGTISLNRSGVVSGVLSTLGTGGTRGATGLSGTSSVTTTPAF